MARRTRGLSSTAVPYYHVVFTLPAAISAIAFQNKAAVYDLLFGIAAETLHHDRRRPEASGRAHRPHRRPPHLGLGADPSSPCPRHRFPTAACAPERIALDRLQARLLPARARAVRHRFPPPPSSRRARQLPAQGQPPRLLRRPRPRAQANAPSTPLSRRCAAQEWVVCAKRPFAGPSSRPRLSLPLHPIAWRSRTPEAHRARQGGRAPSNGRTRRIKGRDRLAGR